VVAAENCIVNRVRTSWLVCLASHGMRYLVQACSVNPSVSRTVFIVHSVNDFFLLHAVGTTGFVQFL